ncbi:MAG: response regulator [Bdellovibrionota bacterium]
MPRKRRVLIADDDEAIQVCMEDISQQEGWDLHFAKDGAECLAMVAEQSPSLLILDQRMPHMTGEEVLGKLQNDGWNFPVILMSAEKDLSRMRRFPAIIKTLTKPFDLDEFISVVNAELVRQQQSIP